MRRILVSLVTTSLVVAACGAATGPSPAPSSPRAPGETEPPDLNDLRVRTDGWSTDFNKANIDLGEIISGGPPKDGIPAIDEPTYTTVAATREWLEDRAPVVSLEVNGQARAYPIAILMWHEVVNDELGGVPVVVTFCPLCNTALAFERELDGVIHDFGTTGNLRHSDLIMYDRQTETWWQQATGTGIVGELTDRRLTFLPAQMISLAEFERTYPEGDVLSRDTGWFREYGRNPYPGYDNVDQRPLLFIGEIDGRLAPKERVVTVGEADEATAFPYTELRKAGVATGVVDGEPYVVFWLPGTGSPLDTPNLDEGADVGSTGVFRPIADGRELTFTRDGAESAPITDRETGSTWSVTGRAIDGPLAGASLEPLPHGDHFWFAWAAFAPETAIWTVAG